MLRVRVCVPPPHDAVHTLQPDHAPIWQLTGQQTLLQPCDSLVDDSEHEPPHDAGTMVRERLCVPPPQVTEQPDHGVQLWMLQLTGQQPGEQPRWSVR